MADTIRTRADLVSIFPDNITGDISPQDLRDYLATAVLRHTGSAADQYIIRPQTADSTTFFQIMDFDGGAPILNVDSTNERVGIGIAAPEGTLHVHTATAGAVTASVAADDLVVENSSGAGATVLSPDGSAGALVFGSPSSAWGASVSWAYSIGQLNLAANKTGGFIALKTDAEVEAMRIDSSQNVVIGHTVAAGLFRTVTGAESNTLAVDTFSTNATHQSFLSLRRSKSATKGTLTATDSGDALGMIRFFGVDNQGPPGVFDVGARIYALQDGAIGARVPTNLILDTYSSTANNANQLVLHNDGNVGIGTAAPVAKLQVVGDIFPGADDTYYLGKNDDDTPFAWKGLILADTTNGKHYRIEVTNGAVAVIDLTD